MDRLKSSNWPTDRNQHLITVVFLLVAVAYLAQIASPLRLIGDALDYLSQTSSAIDGHGFLSHGVRSMRPPGYPAVLYMMAKLGIANSWTIVGLNCLLLGIGCWAGYVGLRRSLAFSGATARIFCLLTLMSFLMVRNVTYPLSDVCFFGAASVCVCWLLKIEGRPHAARFWSLLLLLPLLVLCVGLRRIGIALIPGFLWAAIGGFAGAKSCTRG